MRLLLGPSAVDGELDCFRRLTLQALKPTSRKCTDHMFTTDLK